MLPGLPNTKFQFSAAPESCNFLHELLHLDDDVGGAIVQSVVVKERAFDLNTRKLAEFSIEQNVFCTSSSKLAASSLYFSDSGS
jgi:hypothetical protein